MNLLGIIAFIIMALLLIFFISVFTFRKCPRCGGLMHCIYTEKGVDGSILFSIWKCDSCGHIETIHMINTGIGNDRH